MIVFIDMPRGRAAPASRWKAEDPYEYIRRSKDAGSERVVPAAQRTMSLSDTSMGENDRFWTWTDEELLPSGTVMVSARKATFDERWPYTGRRGWKPTANKLAEAGFHYTPTPDEIDACMCIYCGVELSGWERSDDPVYVATDKPRA